MKIDDSIFWLLWIIIILSIIHRRRKRMLDIIKKKREKLLKGGYVKMPEELIKEFIGKDVTILLFDDSFGVKGKIIAVEDNWIKVEEKNKINLLNGDMIKDIILKTK